MGQPGNEGAGRKKQSPSKQGSSSERGGYTGAMAGVDCILKLGGSALTQKDQLETLKAPSLRRAAALVAQLCKARERRCIVVHGAGSFGHFQAKKHEVGTGTHKESAASDSLRQSLCLTRLSVTKPFGTWKTTGKNVSQAGIDAVKDVLEAGYIPVLHGDCALDLERHCCILSGDTIVEILAKTFSPKQVVFLTDVSGIYNCPPNTAGARLVDSIIVRSDGTMDPAVLTSARPHDTTGVRTKKSAVSGVTITQFVDNVPRGCSTPDFERKPITLTLQEGKNAIFRAVVKGEPKPELLWQRSTGKIIDHEKYRITSVPGTNEFTLQISDITEDDADVYRFTAVNDYGEATCSAGLKIIQVGFKKKSKDVSVTAAPQTDLKKEITHFRKALKKITPVAAPKKEIDMEQVWQLLLDADRKDYEKICMKYGIVDFRGMLRRLQEMKEEKEIKQAEVRLWIVCLPIFCHLALDGEMINFGLDDDNIKHCLRQVGKKYNFVINDLQPEDAGLYQIKIEDVDIFSTELEAENIPVYFRFPLGDVRCHEEGNAVLQCTLYEPCFTAVWLHKNNRLEPNDKYEISVSDDGLMHRLVIKNAQPSDKGTYTIDIGRRTSSAWLEVESAKGKRKQLEGDSDDKVGWRKKQLEEDRSKKLRQGEAPEDQDHPADSNMGKAGQYGRGQKGSLGKDGKMGHVAGGISGLYGKDGIPFGSGTGGPSGNEGAGSLYGKDGMLGSLDGVSIEKEGPVHKLVIDDVQEKHAGKYKFEAEDIRTEASIFVEGNVDSALLNKMKEEPMVVKAGKSAMVKIPFEGRKPIRATWLKDDGELLDDARISTDCSDDYTRLTISTTNRKDCGDYKVKLKNESGTTEATLKLIVIDKPQPPTGPIEVVDCSTSGITIQWKPPKDDGGKPIKSYVIERQQVGRKTWLTLGEINGNTTVFTTNKVEHDKSYYFRVKAVNAEGTSEVLESDEVMAAAKVFPGPPAPPKITSTSKGAISLSWAAPHKTGNSRIVGYTIEKCKKGSNSWTPVTDVPITGKKYTVTDLKEGLQYEFRVAAINTAGMGEASVPSEAAFAWDPMKPPGPVRDLKVVNTDYSSISLSWLKPESKEESLAKGYIVEMRHSDSLKWTQCNSVPLAMTTYIVRGLKAREMYFLRVRAINDGGWGEAVELDTCVQTVPPSVGPKVLGKDSIKSFMIVKAGNTLRIRIPFEASPPPEVFWQKDGKALPAKATTTTREGLSQLIIPRADFSDSGHYAIVLRTETGKKETFGFLVQVLDVPESPGPIQLVEKVPETVTLIWEPSPTEMRDRTLNYMVMRRDSYKGSWELVTDLIYTNKCTVANFVPGREYLFRVLAKNYMGVSEPSETVQPWSIHRERGKYEIKLPKYKGINHHHPPRFLVPLKPHVVILGFDCHMSCAVTGCPAPKVTWYKDGKNISKDPAFYSKNDFGICSLMIPGVTPADAGQYMVVAINELGEANSKAELTIKVMLHSPSPLKTALAYECFQDQANSTLALPSDHKLKTRGTGKQRVQEQVMLTVKRQKQKTSLSSASNAAGHSNRGSMYDGFADGYGYGTARGSYYAKAHTGNNWGHGMYNGTLKREVAENKRYSSYSQMDSWGARNYNKICSPTTPGSDYCFVQNMKSSRSEPDLYCDAPRGTLRRNQSGSRVNHKASLHRHSLYSNTCNSQGINTTTRTSKRIPARSSSYTSANKHDVVYSQPVASKPEIVYGQPPSNS
ncbi:hypothetical protein JRQ81_013997, partial [Phrynocephalus forsythii]